jgi:adenylosuccinate lyase
MRRYGVADAYERLKEATRGKATVTRQDLLTLVESCAELPPDAKEALRQLTPQTYVGLAKDLALRFALG